MEHVSIIQARPADREAVVALLMGQMSEHRTRSEKRKLSRLYNQILADERYGFLLVAKVRDETMAVAYVSTILSIEHGSRVGWVEELYVRPEYREAGIGGALLNSVIRLAQKRNLSALDLEVDIEHRRAESLYRRFGFRRLPRSRWTLRRLRDAESAPETARGRKDMHAME